MSLTLPMLNTTNLMQEFQHLSDYWSPRVVAQVNNQYVKVAKLKGSFVWHKHDNEDELFHVLKGNLVIEYEHSKVHLAAGDIHVVPKGVMHNPVAAEECWVTLIETVTTQHTGDETTALTKSIQDQLAR